VFDRLSRSERLGLLILAALLVLYVLGYGAALAPAS